MFPKSKFTKIYYISDNFCKKFSLQQKKYTIKDKKLCIVTIPTA